MSSLFNSFQLHILNIERCTLTEKWNYKNICSPFFRMFYILDGSGFISLDNIQYKLLPGNLYLIPNYTNCSYSCNSHLEMIYIIFIDLFNKETGINHLHNLQIQVPEQNTDKELFSRLLKINPNKALLDYDPQQYDNWKYLDKSIHLEKGETVQDFTETKGTLLLLFSRFLTTVKNDSSLDEKSRSNIIQSIQYINENLDQKLDLEILSAKAFLSPDYYSRLFLKITKCRPIEYIQRKRIEKTQLLLITTNLSLEKIAELTGLNSSSYLIRLFKRHTQMSPGKYRKSKFV